MTSSLTPNQSTDIRLSPTCDPPDNAREKEPATSIACYDECLVCRDNKEPCPYIVGSSMVATHNEPPEPVGHDYDTPWPEGSTEEKSMPFCLQHQPRTCHTDEESAKTLIITSIIRTGYNRGPQLVVVNDNLAAKLFDPIFYNTRYDDDVVYSAHAQYSREAAAYKRLQECSNLADIVPTYHGNWTVHISTTTTLDGCPVVYKRPVRLILLEYIQGCSMDSLDPHHLPESTRSAILKRCIDAETRIFSSGIKLDDFCPRKVMLVGSNFESLTPLVKIVNFGKSTDFYHPRYRHAQVTQNVKARIKRCAPRYDSPLRRWWRHLSEFIGWYPEVTEAYDGDDEWLWRQYKDDDRYAPVVWDPANPSKRPKYQEEI